MKPILNFTERTTEYLIRTRAHLLGTIKFQPILAEGCIETIAKINEELDKRGMLKIRTNHELIKIMPL